MANILVIDDDKKICEALTEFISQQGHSSDYVLLLKEGLEKNFTYQKTSGRGIPAVSLLFVTRSSANIRMPFMN